MLLIRSFNLNCGIFRNDHFTAGSRSSLSPGQRRDTRGIKAPKVARCRLPSRTEAAVTTVIRRRARKWLSRMLPTTPRCHSIAASALKPATIQIGPAPGSSPPLPPGRSRRHSSSSSYSSREGRCPTSLRPKVPTMRRHSGTAQASTRGSPHHRLLKCRPLRRPIRCRSLFRSTRPTRTRSASSASLRCRARCRRTPTATSSRTPSDTST